MRSIRAWRAFRTPHTVPLLGILAAVLAANLPALLHLVTANPLVLDAGLTDPVRGWLPGLPYIDPNTGFTTQALGHLAAQDWLHGHIPWWNPYEGVGAPLAGEMQSGAFFPPTLLLLFHDGILFLQLLLETATGWATYFLLRRLGAGRTVSTGAAIAFGLCGTFAWITHAPMRPIALLPLCLLGVEFCVDAGVSRRRGGWVLLAVALALSILAGFPETTLIDGLLVAWWAVLRLAESGRGRRVAIIGRLAAGGAVGVALAAPLLAAFAAYLPSAYVGGHTSGFAYSAIPSVGLVQSILPYSLGPIFGFQSTSGNDLSLVWGSVGGYMVATLIAAALVGLCGRRLRLLRIGLGGWIALELARTYGWPPVTHAMAHVPGLREVAYFRYANPSWELAVVVLAALGLDDIARLATRARVLVAAGVTTGLVAAWAAATAWPLLSHATAIPPTPSAHPTWYAAGSLAFACVALALLVTGGLLAVRGGTRGRAGRDQHQERIDRGRRRGRALMAGVVAAESVALLGFTYLSAPPPTPLQLGSVAYLQQHLATQRFYTLGPIAPDYGSYFGIGQANVNDLPLPKSWDDYFVTGLDPNAPRGLSTGISRVDAAGPTPAEELTAHLGQFEAVGVRYVVEGSAGTDAQGHPFPAAGSPTWPLGPRLVYHDSLAQIWELPGTAPLFSSDGPCTVSSTGWDVATVDCTRPATLVRRVQYMPGWTATVDGMSVPLHEDRSGPAGLFQQVAVPAGRSTVTFSYLPAHAHLAVGVAMAALVFVLVYPLVLVVRRRRERPPAGVSPGPPATR